jgi:DNA polymerase III subunit delta'
MSELSPRTNPELLGHAQAEQELVAATRSGRLHHGWLMAGPMGIGKATLAYRFARWLLAGAPGESLQLPPEHPVFRRMAAGGHGDLVEIAPNDKGNLGIDAVRQIEPLFRRTAAEGGWRIALIDGADGMTTEAQNALLKILEEPPTGAVIILVAEQPGRLLPTIRSRVRRLNLAPLSESILHQLLSQHAPDLTEAERGPLLAMAEGSLGKALALRQMEGIVVYRELLALLDNISTLPAGPMLDYAEKLGRKGGEAGYALTSRLFPDFLAGVARLAAGADIPARLEGEGAVAARLAGQLGLEKGLQLWDNVRELFSQADRLNLDRKQTLLSALLAVKDAAA